MYENDIAKLKRLYSDYRSNGQLSVDDATHTIKCTDTAYARMANDDFFVILKNAYTLVSTDKKDLDLSDILSTYYMTQGTEAVSSIIELENKFIRSRNDLCAIKVKSKNSPECYVTLPDPLYFLSKYEEIKTLENQKRNVDDEYAKYAKDLTAALDSTVKTNQMKANEFVKGNGKN